VLAGFGLIFLAPLLAGCALAIKWSSPGPIFFRQERVGQGGFPFQIINFRTMGQQANRLGPRITVHRDHRLTKIGGWLRRFKLDELPQLWNVLRGEMSLVGPRPELPVYVDLYSHEYRSLLRQRPGITHRVSLLFRDEDLLLAKFADPEKYYLEIVMPWKLNLYHQYLAQQSLKNDLRTILATIILVIFGSPRGGLRRTAPLVPSPFLGPVIPLYARQELPETMQARSA
jgi:lipopolysaccharide/colanic/teichoic acid biosynthesis glycosyltransferase